MAEIVTDDFNRGDSGTLGANWTKLTAHLDVSISGNHARGTAADYHMDRYTGAAWTGSATDHYAEGEIGTAGSFGGPSVRTSSSNTFYLLYGGTSATSFYKSVSGSWTYIGDGGTGFVSGALWRVEVEGTTLTIKRNGSTEYSITDSSIASGNPGLFMSDTTLTFNSWAAGDFAVAGGIPKVNHLLLTGVG